MMSLSFSNEELNSLNQLKELAQSLFPNSDSPIIGQAVNIYDFDFRGKDLVGKCLYSFLRANTGDKPMQTWKACYGSAEPGTFLYIDPSGTPLQYSNYKEQRGEDWRYYGDVQLLSPG